MAMDSDSEPCRLKVDKPEEENLEMEKETDTAELENCTEEQATYDVEIKREILDRGEKSEIEDARRKKEKSEMELEQSSELEEGELADEGEESEKAVRESKEEKGVLREEEGEVNKLQNGEEVGKRAVEEDRLGEEEVSNFEIKQEENETDQEPLFPVIPGEVITDAVQNQELKAFKAHRWLDENYNGSESSGDDESSHQFKVEFRNSDSDCEAERPQMAANKQQNQKKQTVKTRGEFSLEDLPPIEKLQITVGDDVELVEVGVVLHSVGVLVVVESKPNLPPLDADTILFLEGKKVLGKIFDTIGRVIRPCYTVRFNSASEIEELGIKDGMSVFYAPLSKEWTNYVFMAHIMKIRGSDASWEHDNEPPPQFVDYSDDESERQAKAKLRGKPEEDSPAAANESRGKRKKKNPNQQSRGFGNSMNANRGRGNTMLNGEDNRTVQFSSTEWHTNQPLTSWPPKQQINRPREPVMRHRWARRPAQQASTVQFSGLPPAIIPFPDLNQPPPVSMPAHPPSQFGLPPPRVHGLPPAQVPPPQRQVTPLFQMRPLSFSQGSPASQWRPFQNAPPYSFTAPPPAPRPVPFYASQLPPPQNGPLHPAFGSAPQPIASFPQFGPPTFFRYQGPNQH